MYGEIRRRLQTELDGIREAGLWKDERIVQGPQGARVAVGGHEVLNFCANNYLGLASEPALVRAAQDGLARWGFGLASVRFICGTQTIHKELEAAIARFLGMEDAVLYTSCFDANGGLFETLLDEPDVVISDALNHASITTASASAGPDGSVTPTATWRTSSASWPPPPGRARG
jgi:glycine C-acetyltransferase